MEERLIGSKKKGKLFVLSAPGGAGKTTLARLITEEFPSVVESISYTTRDKRPGEKEGVDYFFVSKEEFEKKRARGDFLEAVDLFDVSYGTDAKAVAATLESGKHLLLVIDVNGAKNVLKKEKAITIFIFPPTLEELKRRLIKRGRDSSEEIEKRLKRAEEEISLGKEFDYHIVNEKIDVAHAVLRSILIAEDHKKE